MVWKPDDAHCFCKLADTPARRRRWAAKANAELASGADEYTALRRARAMILAARIKIWNARKAKFSGRTSDPKQPRLI